MNEENSYVSGEKPRKKKRSLWWLWFLLILASFAGGTVLGLKINTLPLPNEVRDRLYPVLEAVIPGSTTPRTPDAAVVTPAPTAAPAPTEVPAPVLTAAPAPTEVPAPVLTETPAPTEVPAPVLTETPAPTEVPVPASETPPALPEAETAETMRAPDTAAFESAAEPAKKYIGVGAALEIALKHAEIEETDAEIGGVYRTKDDDGEAIYEVGFSSGELSYTYKIDAYDGEIVGWKMSGFSFSDDAAYAADFAGNDQPEAAVTPAPAAAKDAKESNKTDKD